LSATTRPAAGGPLPVLILAGQSNMVGWVTLVADLSPGQRAVQLAHAEMVRQAQAQVAAAVPNVRLIDTDRLPLAPDLIHYTSAGTVALGQVFAITYLDWRSSQSYVFLPMVVGNR
jgi:hypothetical protein